MTFSNAVSVGTSWKFWNTNPVCSLRTRARASSSRSSNATPARTTEPLVARSSPAQRPSSVVLPLPDGPTMAHVAPAASEKLTSLSTVNSRSPLR